jgi:hypothetical protein
MDRKGRQSTQGETPTKVLFIMGHGASGSTLLGNVLGELEGFFHPGELRTLWDEGMRGLQRCGCGLAVSECSVWSGVVDTGFGDRFDDPAQVDEVARWHRQAIRVRHALRLLQVRPGRPSGRRSLDAYIPVAARLYEAVAQVTGSRVVVDSSKRAGDAALLRLLPGIDPYLVHLVRDPRAVAYSWRRRNSRNRLLRTTRDWVAFSLLDEAVRFRLGRGRSMRVRYEDFVAQPKRTLTAIAALVGEGHPDLSLVEDGKVRLGQNHTMSGHWSRFSTGMVELREDDEWRSLLPAADRMAVTAVSLPLLARYGYPIRGR